MDEPDDVVKAAFIPVSDGNEVPSALLGIHRAVVGAVSKRVNEGLIDEFGLVSSMAGMREKIAGDAIDAIASRQDEESAGMLVRDWCDQAELGALKVYRAAVSKGVTPAAAAHRAAGIYGVPAEHLGKYLAIASDAKSSPQMLVDAADRSLMDHVRKISAPEPDPIEKAERPWREDLVTRDSEGQFARSSSPRARVLERYQPSSAIPAGIISMVNNAVEQIEREKETAPVKTPTKEQSPEQQRRQEIQAARQRRDEMRAKRQKREDRQKSRQKRADRQASSTATSQPSRMKSRAKTRESISRAREITRAKVRAANDRIKQKSPQFAAPEQVFDASPVKRDLMARTNYEDREYGKLDENMTFYVTGTEWAAIRAQMGDEERNRSTPAGGIARLGNLVTDVDGGDVVDDQFYEQAISSRQAVQDLAHRDVEQIHRLPEGSTSSVAHPLPVAGDVDEEVDAALEELMFNGREGSVVVYEAYSPYQSDERGSADAYVVQHIHEGDSGTVSTPKVVELVVHDASGEVVGSGSGGYRSLDPDQVYRVSSHDDPYGSVHDMDAMWDPNAGVVVQRVHLFPVDDPDVTKADRPWREADVRRDELGQFAVEGVTRVKLAGIAERMMPAEDQGKTEQRRSDADLLRAKREARAERDRLRSARIKRSERNKRSAARAQSPEATRSRLADVSRERDRTRTRGRSISRQLQRKPITRTATGARSELVLDQQTQYKAFNKSGFATFLEGLDDDEVQALESGQPVRIGSSMREALFTGAQSDSDVMFDLRVNAEEEENRYIESQSDEDLSDDYIEYDVPHIGADHKLVQREIEQIFDRSPGTAIVEVARNPEGNMTFRYSMRPSEQQYMVDVPDDIDPDKTYYLTYTGTHQLRDLYGTAQEGLRRFGGMMDEINLDGGYALNPSVNFYRVVAPGVQRYRAEER